MSRGDKLKAGSTFARANALIQLSQNKTLLYLPSIDKKRPTLRLVFFYLYSLFSIFDSFSCRWAIN